MSIKVFLLILLLLSSCSLVTGQTPEKTETETLNAPKPVADGAKYPEFVERVKRGDMGVDFGRLRDSFAEWICDDKAKTDAPNRDAMVAAFKAKDYRKAVELVEVVLDYEFVQVGLHRAAEDAYRQLNNKAKADFHKEIADKLINALLTSGDGKTAQTAYRVISIREEYFIMNQLGYQTRSQGLLSQNGKPYDLLSGRDTKTGKEVSVYFDISSFFGGCERTKK